MAITTDSTFDRYKQKKTSEFYNEIIEVFNYQKNYLNTLSQRHLWDLCSLAVNTAPAIATGKYFYSLVNEITKRVKDFQELQATFFQEVELTQPEGKSYPEPGCCGSGRYCNPPCGHENCTDEQCVYEVSDKCEEGETCCNEEEENPDDYIDVIDQAHLSRISRQHDIPGQISLDGEPEQLLGELFACYGWEYRESEGRLQSARKKTANQTVIIDRDIEFPELWNYMIKTSDCLTASRYGILLASQMPEFIQAIFLHKA